MNFAVELVGRRIEHHLVITMSAIRAGLFGRFRVEFVAAYHSVAPSGKAWELSQPGTRWNRARGQDRIRGVNQIDGDFVVTV